MTLRRVDREAASFPVIEATAATTPFCMVESDAALKPATEVAFVAARSRVFDADVAFTMLRDTAPVTIALAMDATCETIRLRRVASEAALIPVREATALAMSPAKACVAL